MASYAEKTKAKPNLTDDNPMTGVKPVFIQESDVFGPVNDTTGTAKPFILNTEMYKNVSDVVPARSIIGLQRIRGLWRIYLDSETDREYLLSKGMEIRGKTVIVYSRNPRVTTNESVNTIRIRVKDVPLSADDGQILRTIENFKCNILTHFRERLRYQQMLTNCLTGDRIIICEGPIPQDIPRSMVIGKYRATILYRGQSQIYKRAEKCTKCLQEGHRANMCPNDWVCKLCGEEGHKQNSCTKGVFSETTIESTEETTQNDNAINSTCNSTDEEKEGDYIGDDENEEDTQTPTNKNSLEEATESCHDLDLSQSVLNPEDGHSQSVRRKRKSKNKSKENKQSNITTFLPSLKATDKSNVNTPIKQGKSGKFEKSPVTPTEVLHDAVSDSVKRSKTVKT